MTNRTTGVLALVALLCGALLWSRSAREGAMRSAARETSAPGDAARVATPIESAAVDGESQPAEPQPEVVTALERVSDAVLPQPKPVSLAAVESLPQPPEREDSTQPISLPPVTALENLRSSLRQYRARFGGNPVGDNAEITAQLNGGNTRRLVLLNPDDGARFNSDRALVDVWNTPYFFHQLSRTEMEIRSAGPDRRMWTADDLVIK